MPIEKYRHIAYEQLSRGNKSDAHISCNSIQISKGRDKFDVRLYIYIEFVMLMGMIITHRRTICRIIKNNIKLFKDLFYVNKYCFIT